MKKAQIREEVAAAIKSLGFSPRQHRWVGCELHIVIAGEFRTLRFPSGMTRRDVAGQLGRLQGWVEMLSEIAIRSRRVRPEARANSHAAAA